MRSKISLLTIVFTGALFTACTNTRAKKTAIGITRDTLNYTYQTIKERAADCGNKPDPDCTVSIINYPVFQSQGKLMDTVTARLVNIPLPGNRPADDLQAFAKNFIADYEKFYKAAKNQNRSKVPFHSSCYARVLRQDPGIITIQLGGYTFAGGAHANELILFLNWNTKEEKPIKLDDIFIANYKRHLTHIAETIFRKQENLKDTSSLAHGYFFKDNKFALNDNFLITPAGIRFFYNQYEIKPYAAGTTDLFIPYTQLKPMLKPHTVLAQYIK